MFSDAGCPELAAGAVDIVPVLAAGTGKDQNVFLSKSGSGSASKTAKAQRGEVEVSFPAPIASPIAHVFSKAVVPRHLDALGFPRSYAAGARDGCVECGAESAQKMAAEARAYALSCVVRKCALGMIVRSAACVDRVPERYCLHTLPCPSRLASIVSSLAASTCSRSAVSRCPDNVAKATTATPSAVTTEAHAVTTRDAVPAKSTFMAAG